jgi:UDP-N-acetylmuramoyl-L-alanyl-D-glutamate--2,6-diaminopimelate ligase
MPTKQVIINADDRYGQRWLTALATKKSVFAYSTQRPPLTTIPFIYCEDAIFSLEGIRAHVYTPWGKGELSLPLIGQFNLSNGLAVLTALCVAGIPFTEVLARLANLHAVPGRMQTLSSKGKPVVVVDYAHKPDALEKVLQALRGHTRGRLGCVFGCGGERDRGKRPLMAKIAEQWADYVVVTNDNPRHEKPEDIIQEIMQGFNHPEQIQVELDRSKAIENSIQWGAATDCILIAGKGAEKYQIFGDEKLMFDDVAEVTKYLGEE